MLRFQGRSTEKLRRRAPIVVPASTDVSSSRLSGMSRARRPGFPLRNRKRRALRQTWLGLH